MQALWNRRPEQAQQFRAAVYPAISQTRDNGQMLTQTADALNRMLVRTANNRSWYPTTVKNVLDGRKK